jgi:ABC-type nitrate/sulfonate/bicarbonate transport system substrate-binding protein
MTPLTVGLGFIPSVQFAQFYRAEQAGYYDEAGLDVTFRHGTDYDVVALVGQGELDLGLADGTSVIPAVSNGIPIKYVGTIYGQFPSIVQLRLSGEEVAILRVDEITPLPGNGLIVGAGALESKRDAITAFVAATLRAMEEISATPEVGLEAALTAVPELAADRDTQAAILDATIEVWRGPTQERGGLGAIEPGDWEASLTFLTDLGLVPNPVTVDDLIDTGLLPGTG